VETRPMTEMEERLMTRFMQADGERNEANRERDEARAERDDAKEWVHHATRMANERDEARADRDALALALKAIKAYTIDPRAHERASKALATLDAGGRNRPPVDGQGGMTIDKGVGGEDD